MERGAGILLLAGLVLGTCIVTESSEVVAPVTTLPPPTSVNDVSHRGEPGNLPVLQPSEAVPITGTFSLKDKLGSLCLKVTMGVEYIVLVKEKPFYYNLEPKSTVTSGYCSTDKAVLSLGFSGNGGSLTFLFQKKGKAFYVTKLNAHLTPEPCKGCPTKTYPGVVANEELFKAPFGRSFKCNSDNDFVMAKELKLKITSLQLQAFNFPKNGTFGKVVECWADFNKRIIPIIIGAVVLGLLLIAVVSFLIIRDRRRPGYERLE